ncbi:MAG: hypothetical protein KDK76_05270 [Chlamydiia bacterium]|nr:hypothetical protein [Chlamydiia bacterium]
MMKNLRMPILVNCIGLLVLFICLFGYQGIEKRRVRSRIVSIDESVLKNELMVCSTKELQRMLSAGEEILGWNAILAKTGSHIVDKVLEGHGVCYEMDHYPLEDTFDQETYSQYYYHIHRGGEHGHFHLFLRQGGMEKEMVPLFYDTHNETPSDIDTYAHLIGISMDEKGRPQSLFTTNRWVTGEDWYQSNDVKKMVDHFHITHAHPSFVVNRWLDAMLALFRLQINTLIDQRDVILHAYGKGIPLTKVIEDHKLEIISEKEISVETQIKMIKEILSERLSPSRDAPFIPLVGQNLGISQSQRLGFNSIEAASYPRDRSDADGVKDQDADEGKNQVLNHERYTYF